MHTLGGHIYLDFQTIDLAAEFFCSPDISLRSRIHIFPRLYIDSVAKIIEALILSNQVHYPPTRVKSQTTADFIGPVNDLKIITPATDIQVDTHIIETASKHISEAVRQLSMTNSTFRETLLDQSTHEYPKWKYEHETYYGDDVFNTITLDDAFHDELASRVQNTWYGESGPFDPADFDPEQIPHFQTENHSLHYQRAAESRERHKTGYMPPISRSREEFYIAQVVPPRALTQRMIPSVAYGLLHFMITERTFDLSSGWLQWQARMKTPFEELNKRLS